MKKIFRYIILFFMIFSFKQVFAVDNLTIRKNRFPNAYAVFNGVDRVHLFYAQSYTINNEIAYCIEPGIDISSNSYSSTEDFSVTNLDKDTINKIRLIAYYGFAYNVGPHLNDRYYMASQELIWKEITGRDTYWVSEEDINGARINIDKEKEIINNLVSSHYILPSFDNQVLEVEVGKTYKIIDENNVLSRFQLYENDDSIKIKDNYIEYTPKSFDDTKTVKLIAKSYTDKVSFIYYSGNSQKLMSTSGVLEPLVSSFKIKVLAKPQIKVTKVDRDSKEKLNIKGLKFKIKDLTNNKYICESDECIFETDDNGEFITNTKLAYGNYQIEELDQKIKGYLVNKEPLKFTINEDSKFINNNGNIYLEYQFENKSILGSVEIVKIGEVPIYKDGTINYTFDKLNNVVLNLYALDDIYSVQGKLLYKKDDIITSVKTENGVVKIDNLPLGDYYIKEISTNDGYILDNKKYTFSLEQNNNLDEVTAKIEIKNYLSKGVFKFTKIDSLTNIGLANATIEIYNDDNKLITTAITDDNGKIIVEGLPLGKYYYIETVAPMGYSVDNQKYYFQIKENNEIVNANLVNEKIIVPSTNLNKNYNFDILCICLSLIGLILFGFGKK